MTFKVHNSACSGTYERGLRDRYHRMQLEWVVSAHVLADLCAASWGGLKGLSRFDVEFVESGVFRFGGRFYSGHESLVEFREQVRAIVMRRE